MWRRDGDQLVDRSSAECCVASLYNAACTYGLLEMKAEAVGMLKRAAETGFSDMEWVSRDPDLACLHGDPEFERLIEGQRPAGV